MGIYVKFCVLDLQRFDHTIPLIVKNDQYSLIVILSEITFMSIISKLFPIEIQHITEAKLALDYVYQFCVSKHCSWRLCLTIISILLSH